MDLVRLLMYKYGANDYDTALAGACFGGHMDIVQMMIKYGATQFNCYVVASIGRHSEIYYLLNDAYNEQSGHDEDAIDNMESRRETILYYDCVCTRCEKYVDLEYLVCIEDNIDDTLRRGFEYDVCRCYRGTSLFKPYNIIRY
jgi:hypothetical protein